MITSLSAWSDPLQERISQETKINETRELSCKFNERLLMKRLHMLPEDGNV